MLEDLLGVVSSISGA